MKDIDRVSGDVLDVALRLHKELGPGLLESVYEGILARRLEMTGYAVSRTYLRLLKQPVGLLINFGGATLIEGVKRVVNSHMPSALSASLRENNLGE